MELWIIFLIIGGLLVTFEMFSASFQGLLPDYFQVPQLKNSSAETVVHSCNLQ
jgi:hypothetical protein